MSTFYVASKFLIKGMTNYGVNKIVTKACKQLINSQYGPLEQVCVEMGIMGLSGAAVDIVGTNIDKVFTKAEELINKAKEEAAKKKEKTKDTVIDVEVTEREETE